MFAAVLIIVLFNDCVHAGNFSIRAEGGYGAIKYEEKTSDFGTVVDSEAVLDTMTVGISGEYSSSRIKPFFAGVSADWAFGFRDNETWKENGTEIQENDIDIFAQFYSVSLGYKNDYRDIHYSMYLSGGWDGVHFERSAFIVGDTLFSDNITEDFSLWRTGIGGDIGYEKGKWVWKGNFELAYYLDGTVKNSALSQFRFKTTGIGLDTGIGIEREITERIDLYLGGNYRLINLDKSNVLQDGSIRAVFPKSKTQILSGSVRLAYHF